jgi:hypothetical protein
MMELQRGDTPRIPAECACAAGLLNQNRLHLATPLGDTFGAALEAAVMARTRANESRLPVSSARTLAKLRTVRHRRLDDPSARGFHVVPLNPVSDRCRATAKVPSHLDVREPFFYERLERLTVDPTLWRVGRCPVATRPCCRSQ